MAGCFTAMALTTALVFVLFSWLESAFAQGPMTWIGRERSLGLLLGVVFWGVGVVARICQLCQLLTQTMPTAARIGDGVCVVLWLGNLFMQKAEERDKSCSQQHFDPSFFGVCEERLRGSHRSFP